MCVLDVIFNAFLIFPTREIVIGGSSVTLPGAGLGVAGAALGTALAEVVAGTVMMVYLWRCNKEPEPEGMHCKFPHLKGVS